MKEEKFVESPLMRAMYGKFIDEFDALSNKYLCHLIVNDIKDNNFADFVLLALIGSACCLLVLLEKMTDLSFDDIINNIIPAGNEKLIKVIKEIKNIENLANQ
jgi:hypothetical protein